MGKQYTGTKQSRKNNRYRLPVEYTDFELTDMSPKPVKTPTTVSREAVASLYCGKAVSGQWPVMSTATDKQVATLSLRRERLCFMIRPGVPGADGKMHIINSKRRKDGLAAIARKIAGFMVEVPA